MTFYANYPLFDRLTIQRTKSLLNNGLQRAPIHNFHIVAATMLGYKKKPKCHCCKIFIFTDMCIVLRHLVESADHAYAIHLRSCVMESLLKLSSLSHPNSHEGQHSTLCLWMSRAYFDIVWQIYDRLSGISSNFMKYASYKLSLRFIFSQPIVCVIAIAKSSFPGATCILASDSYKPFIHVTIRMFVSHLIAQFHVFASSVYHNNCHC